MTVRSNGGNDRLHIRAAVQHPRAADPVWHDARPAPVAAPDPVSSFAAPHDRPVPVPSGTAPHFLGALLVACPVGLVSAVAALLVGRSILEALAVYSLTGLGVFAVLVIIRSGPKDRGT